MMQIQSILTVKNEFVGTYGSSDVSSGFGAKTINVAQLSFIFSTLNTEEVESVPFNVYGIDNNWQLQVYNVTGLVLKQHASVQIFPKNGLPQEFGILSI